MKVHIITIGDEILIGQIIDTNSAWMAEQLNLAGFEIDGITSVSDTKQGILDGVNHAFKNADIVLATGGLGPTKDDITKKVLADYFGTSLSFHEATYNHLLGFFKQFGREPNQSHREQCFMPEGIQLLTNKKGTAPGMWFEQAGKVLVSMPGVPYEMKYLMEFEVIPNLLAQFTTTAIAHRTVLTAGIGESTLAEEINDFVESMPSNIKIAYLPSLRGVRLRLTGIGQTGEDIQAILNEQVEKLNQLIPHHIFGYEKETLAEVVGRILKEQGKTVCTLESCTGGEIAAKIVAVSGSSAYFQGSVVAYSNEIKNRILKVKSSTLATEGAVSEATVIEMVQGGLNLMKTDYALAISGIAGPTGGTPTKPVGTVWIAIGNKDRIVAKKIGGTKDRAKNIERSANYALNYLRKFLLSEI